MDNDGQTSIMARDGYDVNDPKLALCLISIQEKTLDCDYSAVVGSITERTRAMLFAGNPPFWACVRTVSSSGAT